MDFSTVSRQFKEYGFTHKQTITALKLCENNSDEALSLLLSGAMDGEDGGEGNEAESGSDVEDSTVKKENHQFHSRRQSHSDGDEEGDGDGEDGDEGGEGDGESGGEDDDELSHNPSSEVQVFPDRKEFDQYILSPKIARTQIVMRGLPGERHHLACVVKLTKAVVIERLILDIATGVTLVSKTTGRLKVEDLLAAAGDAADALGSLEDEEDSLASCDIMDVALSPSGRHLLFAIDVNDDVCMPFLLDLETMQLVENFSFPREDSTPPSFFLNDDCILRQQLEGENALLQLTTGKTTAIGHFKTQEIDNSHFLGCSRNGTHFAVHEITNRGTTMVCIYDSLEGRECRRVGVSDPHISGSTIPGSMAISQDMNHLLSVSIDNAGLSFKVVLIPLPTADSGSGGGGGAVQGAATSLTLTATASQSSCSGVVWSDDRRFIHLAGSDLVYRVKHTTTASPPSLELELMTGPLNLGWGKLGYSSPRPLFPTAESGAVCFFGPCREGDMRLFCGRPRWSRRKQFAMMLAGCGLLDRQVSGLVPGAVVLGAGAVHRSEEEVALLRNARLQRLIASFL